MYRSQNWGEKGRGGGHLEETYEGYDNFTKSLDFDPTIKIASQGFHFTNRLNQDWEGVGYKSVPSSFRFFSYTSF